MFTGVLIGVFSSTSYRTRRKFSDHKVSHMTKLPLLTTTLHSLSVHPVVPLYGIHTRVGISCHWTYSGLWLRTRLKVDSVDHGQTQETQGETEWKLGVSGGVSEPKDWGPLIEVTERSLNRKGKVPETKGGYCDVWGEGQDRSWLDRVES